MLHDFDFGHLTSLKRAWNYIHNVSRILVISADRDNTDIYGLR